MNEIQSSSARNHQIINEIRRLRKVIDWALKKTEGQRLMVADFLFEFEILSSS